ncbi:MAG: hypothetical protein RI962_1286 [Pseudomonadota bacterium]
MATTTNTISTIPSYAVGIIEGGLAQLNLLSGVFDAEGDTLRWTLTGVVATDPSTGAVLGNSSLNDVSITATGSFIYRATLDLAEGQARIETFNFMVYDGMAYSTASVQVTVSGAGSAVPAPDDYGVAVSGQPISLNVLGNDGGLSPDGTRMPTTVTSINGQPLSANTPVTIYHPTTAVVIGTVAKNVNETLIFTPLNGYTGKVSFSYGAIYELGSTSEVSQIPYSQQVVIDVLPPPVSAPVGVADVYTLPLAPIFNIGQMQGVLVNDLGASGAGIGAQLVRGPSQGVLDFNSDGSFTYQATPEMLNSTPGTVHQVSFSYRVLNGVAQDTDETLVTLQLRASSSVPVAADDVLAGTEDQRLVITPESLFGSDGAGPENDTQADGQPFTEIRITRLPSDGTIMLNGVAISANTVVSAAQLVAGQLVFLPVQNFSGSTSFDYSVRSNDGYSLPATVTLNIAAVADAPVPLSQPTQPLVFFEAEDATAQSLTAAIDTLEFYDPDSSRLSLATIVELIPRSPTTQIPAAVIEAFAHALSLMPTTTAAGAGTLLTVTPMLSTSPMNLDFLAAGERIYIDYKVVVTDGDGLRSIIVLPVELVGTNDAPNATNFQMNIRVGELSQTAANLLAQVTDPDVGDTVRLVGVNDQDFGGNASISLPTVAGIVQINTDGSYRVLPGPDNQALASGESVPLNLVYRVADNAGGTSFGNALLTIAGINDAPLANTDHFGPVLAGSSSQLDTATLLANDSDPDNGETALLRVGRFGFMGTVVDIPASGSTTLNGTYGVLTINADGRLSYAATTAASNALIKGALASDNFSYSIKDPAGASSDALLSFDVVGANHAPTTISDSYTFIYGQPLTVAASSGVLKNDSDYDSDTLSAVLQSGPSNGTLTLNADGSFTYTPTAGFIGADSFTYRSADGSESSAATQVSITVQAPPLKLEKQLFINEIAVNAGTATITINTNNGALPDQVTTGVGRIELFNFSGSSVSATDLAKASLEVVGLNAKLSVIGLDHLTGLTESANGTPLTGMALQPNGSLVLYEPNSSGIGIWQTYSASGTLLLSGTYQDNSWGLGSSVTSPIAINLVEQGLSIDFFAANGAPLSGLTDSGSTQTSLSGIAALASGPHAQGSLTAFQLPDLSSPWFGKAQLSPSATAIPGDVLSLLNQNAQFSGLLASSSDTVFARTYDHYLAASGGGDTAFVDYNDAGDWTYGGRSILTLGRENVVLSRSAPRFVANTQDAVDDANPLQGYQSTSDLIAGVSNESGQTIAVFSGFGEGGRGHDFLYGVASDDFLFGSNGNDFLYGSGGTDWLEGGTGADRLFGGTGNDRLYGGSGSDRLNGGSGNDIFIFRSLAESASSTPDIIEDFSRGVDKIDVSAIDANTRRSNDQAFAFAGRSGSAVPNSLSWFESGGNTIVQVDVDGNRAADMEIVLVGTSLGLTAADFVL